MIGSLSEMKNWHLNPNASSWGTVQFLLISFVPHCSRVSWLLPYALILPWDYLTLIISFNNTEIDI